MHEFIVFKGDKRKYVHLMSPISGGEFTACGMAFDIDSEIPELGHAVSTDSKTVTCNDCIEVIKHYRGVRFKI